ncbi:MAG: SDR family oxidoreductase [Gammaproteobacteria bacterium]|nr:MAG: SDR family oxidoreductase [Gammaproteobacteria bacterium]
MANLLVIGGTKGIGQALTQSLINQRHQVFFAARNKAELEGASFVELEVTQEINDQFNGLPDVLDGVVYCPGSINLKPFARLSSADFLKDLQINLLGAVNCLQALHSRLKKAEHASVVLFSSVAATRGMPFHASIASSKAAVEGLTKSLAAEWAPAIRVNCVAPSLTQTPLAEKLTNTAEKIENAAQKHPLNRIGQPEEIAALANFLLSPQSSWMTGQVLHVDGGMSAIS